jgi:hypothetical protein
MLTGKGARIRRRSGNGLVPETAEVPWPRTTEEAKADAYAPAAKFRAKGGTAVLHPEEPRMSDFTRGEFEARLEATEERMNARLAGIEADLRVLLNKADTVSAQTVESKAEAGRAREEASRARDAALNNRWTVVAAFLATGLTVVGLVYAILGYGLQSFEAAIAAMRSMPSP